MVVAGLISVIVFVLGLVVYFFCLGVKKETISEVARIAFAMGLLAFLMSSGARSCSTALGEASTGAQHR